MNQIKYEAKFKSAHIKVKELGGEQLFFSGYASVFNVVDCDGDCIMPGSFADTLKNLNEKSLILFWQHNTVHPIGKIINICEDDYGLFVECSIILNTAHSKTVADMIASGLISGLSIGYTIQAFYPMFINNVRHISKINLIEISVVNFPANSMARIHPNSIYDSKKYEMTVNRFKLEANSLLQKLQPMQ